ncbi:MAG: S9 family peptidase [Aeromicrobium sp.]|nr:MAG: S9 family peptidase [Aeromicrobium sp.]
MTLAPQPPRIPTTRSHHGDDFVDHYEWMRSKDDEAVIAHLESENEYAATVTHHLGGLREEIFEEIKGRTKETDMSIPSRRRGWWYYSRIVKGQDYSASYRTPVHDQADWEPPNIDTIDPADEFLMLDGNAEAEGHDFFSLGGRSMTQDDNRLAWAVDTVGDERYSVNVLDLQTGDRDESILTNVGRSIMWSDDGKYLFYVRVDESWRPYQVWRHEFRAGSDDVLVFEEPDESYFVGIGKTNSEKYYVIYVGSKITSEYRYLPAENPTGDFEIIWPRHKGVEYAPDHVQIGNEDYWLIVHNRQHPNSELAIAPVTDPQRVETLIAGDGYVRLEDASVYARHVYVSYRKDALPQAGIMRITPSGLSELEPLGMDGELVSYGIAGAGDFDPKYVRVGVSSYTSPARVYDLNPDTREMILRREGEVLGDFDPDDYHAERLWVIASDGAKIPVSIVARKDTPRDGTAPALLTGYGSYEISLDPGFSIPRLSLLDRGFVYAVAHVRGGGEMGRLWYDTGKMLDKRNTFTDFVACAHALVESQWTSHDRLVAEGGSAGGLLVGAALNIAPEAFCGVLADVPFVDPLTSILDPSLPLTVIEWDEWGNPLADQEVYEYMKSYSPYETLQESHYPAVLAVTSLNDTRVLYVEPAKWIAQMRETSTGGGPFLLKTEMKAGHGGVSGRYAAWRDRAWELAWIIDVATGGRARNPRTS